MSLDEDPLPSAADDSSGFVPVWTKHGVVEVPPVDAQDLELLEGLRAALFRRVCATGCRSVNEWLELDRHLAQAIERLVSPRGDDGRGEPRRPASGLATAHRPAWQNPRCPGVAPGEGAREAYTTHP
jgi:hypothetical protein